MTREFLARALAGAGLGAASLLICAPGVALADGGPPNHEHERGHVYTEPKGVKPGQEFKIILKCDRPVEFPWAWSAVTGKIWLRYEPPRPSNPPTQPTPPSQPPTQPTPSTQPTPPTQATQPPVVPPTQPPVLPPAQPSLPRNGGQVPLQDELLEGGQPDGQGGQGAVQNLARYEAKYWTWAKAPGKTKPGRYELKGSCDSRGVLVILPKGHVDGGDGGLATAGGGDGRVAAGASVLGVAALGGVLLLRRRRTGGSPA